MNLQMLSEIDYTDLVVYAAWRQLYKEEEEWSLQPSVLVSAQAQSLPAKAAAARVEATSPTAQQLLPISW